MYSSMSNVIPIVSSSPPPLDDDGGFKWEDDDDDDDEYGHFTSAATTSATTTSNHSVSLNWSNSEQSVSDRIPSIESSSLHSTSEISLEKSAKPISDFGDRSSPCVDSVYVSPLKLSSDGDKADENDDEFQDFAHFENTECLNDSSPFSEKDPDSKFEDSEVKMLSKFDGSEVKNISKFDNSEVKTISKLNDNEVKTLSKFDDSELRTHRKTDVVSSNVDKDDFQNFTEFNNIITDGTSVKHDDSSVQLDNEEQLDLSMSSSDHPDSHLPAVHDHIPENCVAEKEGSNLNHSKNTESIYSSASTVDSGVFSTDLSPSFHPEVSDSNIMFDKDSRSTNVASPHDDLTSSTYAESSSAVTEPNQVIVAAEYCDSVSAGGSRPSEADNLDISFSSKAATHHVEDIQFRDSDNSSGFVSTTSHSGVTDSESFEKINPEANTHHISQELDHPADLTNSLAAAPSSLVLNSTPDDQTPDNCSPSLTIDTSNDAVKDSSDNNVLLASNSNFSDLKTHVECNINRSVECDDLVQSSSKSEVKESTSQDAFSTSGVPNLNSEINDNEGTEEDKKFGDFSTFGNHISDEEQDIAPITFRTSLCEPDNDESLHDFVVGKEEPPSSEDDSDDFTDFDSAKNIDAVCVSEKEEPDDDFGDFDSAQIVPISKVVAGIDPVELNESDEFGDFGQPDTLEGGDSGWADFEAAAPTSSGEVDSGQPVVVQQVPAPAITELSKAQKLHKALLGCFPELLGTEQAEDQHAVQVNNEAPVVPETSSGTPEQRSLNVDTDPLPLDMIVNLGLSNPLEAQQQTWTVVQHPAKKDPKVRTWSHLKDVDSCHALTFSWQNSQCSRQVFTTLHIDTQNILFTHKKQAVPFFTSGLGILEPVRGGGGGIGVADRKKDKNNLSSGVATLNNNKLDTLQSSAQQDLPAVDFDWSSSGLTNPLTDEWDWVFKVDNQEVSSTPLQPLEDILKKTTPTVRLTSSEVLSPEALQVLQKMPDLTFMQSRVLMFPVKQ